jgi:RNA polymerase sigma-70 factor, ECF subfamily
MNGDVENILDGTGLASPVGPADELVTTRPSEAIYEVATDELVSRARSGDEEAFSILFYRFHDEIYRYAGRRLGDADAAQDVAAETFADAFSSIRRFRWQGAPFEAWLYTIARRRVVDHRRTRGRRERVDTVEGGGAAADHSGAVVDAANVRSAMKKLSESERAVIELRFMEDLDVEQTALRLGKRAGAVRAMQFRALGRLRAVLQDGTPR